MRGSGGSGSGSGSSGFGLSYNFNLFELKTDGTPTTFTGAIENFEGRFSVNRSIQTSSVVFDFFQENPEINLVTFPSQTADLAANLVQSNSGDTINYQIAPITYQFTDTSNNSQSGTVGLTLSIFDEVKNQDGFQVNVKAQDGTVTTTTIDAGQATSSIEYIISEGLFSSVDGITVFGKDQEGNPSSTGLAPDGSATFTPIIPTDDPATDPTNPDPILNGDDVLSGDNGDNTLDGGEGNNVLRGLEGNDVLTTGSGSDNLDGGNGNDTLRSGGGDDILTSGDGADNIDSGDGNDTVDGGNDNDLILGGGGDDLLRAGNGDDIINGGAGLDVLVGDGGADIFAISTLGGADVIRDFNYGQDLIGLSDGITFDDLIVTQGDGAAILSYQDQAIASISGGTPSQVNASLFTTI